MKKKMKRAVRNPDEGVQPIYATLDPARIADEVNKTVEECWAMIAKTVDPYNPDRQRFLIAARIINALWAALFKPAMQGVMKAKDDGGVI